MLTIANRSIPGPKAQPFHFEESTPNFSKTLLLTTPLPNTSSHVPFLSTSICKEGSVQGNVSGKIFNLAPEPNTSLAIARKATSKSSVPIIFLSLGTKYQPSIWWKTFMWLRSISSFLYTLPNEKQPTGLPEVMRFSFGKVYRKDEI